MLRRLASAVFVFGVTSAELADVAEFVQEIEVDDIDIEEGKAVLTALALCIPLRT